MSFYFSKIGVHHADVLAAMALDSLSDGAWSATEFQSSLEDPTVTGLFVHHSSDDRTSHDGAPAAPDGFALFRIIVDKSELLSIAIQPNRRRLGLGTSLLREVVATTRSAGATSLLLEVADNNSGALALYKREMFCEIDRRKRYYGSGRDAVVLALRFD
ncbi:MAG: GNAT family N-acetyltransferase [Pseudomonadota bacterium]